MISRLAILAAFAIHIQGCHELYKAFRHDGSPIENRSSYPGSYFLYVWSETEAYAQTEIPLDGVLVTVHDSIGAFRDACRDVERLGCSTPTNIDILGSDGTNFVDVGTEFAHQLGHARFSLTDENGDGRHAHTEWFGTGGFVDQIRALLIDEAGQ